MAVNREIERMPRVRRSWHFGFDQEKFLDHVSTIAIREESDVEIRDFTRADMAGKDYWGPDISVLSLADARKRVSPEALEQRIASKRLEIVSSEEEIGRLEKIRTQLYGEQQTATKPTS